MIKYLICSLFLIYGLTCQAQEDYKKERSEFSVINRFGLPNDYTHNLLKSYYSVGVRREFSLGKFVSLNALGNYNTMAGKNANPSLNVVSVGGGVTLYPKYVINKILGLPYDDKVAAKDQFYFDESIEVNLTHTSYGDVGKLISSKFEFNFVKLPIGTSLSILPKLGAAGYFRTNLPSNVSNDPFGFIYIGVALKFGKNI
jgi:hypothetical protein